MALFNCEECSKEISEKASSCPHCGCPNSMIMCPECNNLVPKQAESCTSCGFPFGVISKKAIRSNTAYPQSWENGHFILLLIGSLIIPLLGICFGIYGLTQAAKKEQGVLILFASFMGIFIFWGLLK